MLVFLQYHTLGLEETLQESLFYTGKACVEVEGFLDHGMGVSCVFGVLTFFFLSMTSPFSSVGLLLLFHSGAL